MSENEYKALINQHRSARRKFAVSSKRQIYVCEVLVSGLQSVQADWSIMCSHRVLTLMMEELHFALLQCSDACHFQFYFCETRLV